MSGNPYLDALETGIKESGGSDDSGPLRIPVISPEGEMGSVNAEEYDAAKANGFRARVTTPDGQSGTVELGDLDDAIKNGYHPEEGFKAALSKHIYGGRGLEAGAAGFGRSLTLGLSDLALTKLGLVKPETLSGLKEENPGATIAGEVGGVGASLLIPGLGEMSGLGAATKAGHLAEAGAEALGVAGAETIGKRLAGKIIGGAVEGSLFGAGNVVTEYALGDPDLNAQKIIGEIGLGGLLGMGVSGVSGLLAEGAQAAGPKVGEFLGNLKKSTEEARNTRAVKATGAIQSDINKLSEERVSQIGKNLYESGIVKPGNNAANILEKTRAATKEQWARASDVLKKADDLEAGGFDLKNVVERGHKEVLAEIEGDPALAADARKVSRFLDGYEKLADREEGIGFEKAQKLDSGLRKSIKGKPVGEAEKTAVEKLRGIFRDELGAQLKVQVGDEMAAEFEDAMQKYGDFAEAKKWGLKGIKRIQGNRFFSITDQGLGAATGLLTGGPLGAATGLGGAIVNKVLRERGSSVAAHVLDSISKSETLSRIAEHFAYAVKKVPPDLLGEYAPVMDAALAKSPQEALATHIGLASAHPGYRQAAAIAGFAQETTEQMAHVARKVHALSAIQDAIEHHGEHVGHMVEKALDGAGEREASSAIAKKQDFGSKRMRRDKQASHQKHADDVAKLAANPSELVDRVSQATSGLGQHAPAISAAMAATATRAVNYMAQKLAKPPPAGPLASKWVPSDAEIHKSARIVQAVQDPTSILKHAAAGTLTPDTIDAVKAVYPQYLEHLKGVFLDRLTDEPHVPYRQRVQLGMLLGDLDGTMSPGAILRTQQSYAMPSGRSQDDVAKPRPAGADKLTISSRTMTPAQRAEQRE